MQKKIYNNTEICQLSNYSHTEIETMKLKKFDDTNIENTENNASNLKDILQNNDLYSISTNTASQGVILSYGLGLYYLSPLMGICVIPID